MRLNPLGRGSEPVAAQLRSIASRGHDIGGALSNYASDQITNAYVAWINEIERALREYFLDPALNELHTARHFHICEMGASAPRLQEVVMAEGSWQAARLDVIAAELESTQKRLGGDPSATIAVVDTNVFLHCHPFDQIDWSFVAQGLVRLIVPLRVIEELDAKKRERNSDIANRARQRIRWLRDLLVPVSSGRAALTNSVSVEAFVPVGPRDAEPSADTEILDTCDVLEAFTRQRVKIVTSDLGMQLRGAHSRDRAIGFDVVEVPDGYRIDGVAAVQLSFPKRQPRVAGRLEDLSGGHAAS